MSKRLTLAEQLAQIAEPAPQDFDPEDSYATYSAERPEASNADLEAGRADYLQVGPSGLRKKGEAIVDAKYEGKKGSRKALYEDDDDDDDDENEDQDQDEEGEVDEGSEEDDEAEDEEMGDFEDLEAGSAEDDDDEDGDDDEDEEEDMPPPPPRVKKSSASAKEAKTRSSDNKTMLSQLKQAASADVEKGLDVKKQLSFCDNVLESRIKLQKAATAMNVLPRSNNAEAYFEQVEDERTAARNEVEALNEELFKLRRDLMKRNEQIDLPSNFGQTRKRQRGPESAQEYLKATVSDLTALETALEPFLRTTVTKWSDKVLAASGLALNKDKKFKAINQNAMAQIDHTLAPAERERLVKRTRLRRATDRPIVGLADLGTLEGEKTPADEEVFDDGDYYQQVLRDVIESRMLDLDDPTLESLRHATARSKKQKKVVDTRASKGRKIRYHVHEKIQNFMVPIDAGGWHEEQVDELFASLLGRTFPQAKEVEAEPSRASTSGSEKVDVGSLRIFG